MVRFLVLASLVWGSSLVAVGPAQASLRVSFLFQHHSRHLTSRQARRMRRYRRMGCQTYTLSKREQRFALRALSHAFQAMNDKRFKRIVRSKRFTFTSMSGRSILRKIRTRHRTLPVFGYYRDTGCPVSHSATAFAIYGMIFLRSSYLKRVRRTNNWRRLAQTLAHEWMHGVGFGHGRNGGQGSYRKRNSVPIYIGCLVKYFPRLRAAKRRCSLAKGTRRLGSLRGYRRRRRAPRYPRYRRNYRDYDTFGARPKRAPNGGWLDDGRRGSGEPRSPFYAPLDPAPGMGDWLHGGQRAQRRRPKRYRRPKRRRPKRKTKKSRPIQVKGIEL